MKWKFIVFTGFLTTIFLQACQPAPSAVPQPTATLTITHTVTPSPTITVSPTETASPTPSPTITNTPTKTPTPTVTPIIQSTPVKVELSGEGHSNRPQLSGTVRYVDTAHFRIFYTMSGEDAVQVDDENGNAIPDYVEAVAKALERSWEVEIRQLGWAEPPPDFGLGGDNRFDVYLEDLDLYIAGYVSDEDEDEPEGVIGDNPRTAILESTSAYSFMGLDNDFTEIDEIEDIKLSGFDFMRTTISHEFNHALQFGYDSEEPHGWLWEATATWVETYVYEEIKDSDFHLKPAFKSPDTCLLDYGYGRVESAGHWYAMWVFLRYLSEQFGGTMIRDIWEQTVQLDGYDAIEAALAEKSTSLDEVYRGYTVALLLQDFEFELDYPTVRLEGLVEGLQSWAPNDGVGQMAADFVQIEAEGTIEISIWNLDHGTVVGIQDNEADIYPLENAQTTINADLYDQVYLIVLNLARAETPSDCRMTQYRVRVLKGETALEPQKSLPVENFSLPSVEPLEERE